MSADEKGSHTGRVLGSAMAERVRINMIAFRKRRNLRQEDFAAKCGWGTHVVHRLETGISVWNIEKIERVSEAFGVPFSYFTLPFTGFEEDTALLRILRSLESPAE